MNRYIISFSFCIIVIFCACKEKNSSVNKNSDVKRLTIDLSDRDLVTDKSLFPEFDFVKLETTNESLLSGIIKVVSTDSNFYILSALGGDVMAFNKDGKYLFKLDKGRAPHEVLYPTDIAFSESARQLFVLDRYRTIKVYDGMGKFSKSMSQKDVSLYIETMGDKWITFDSNLDKGKDFYGQIRDEKNIIADFFPKRGEKLRAQNNMIYPHPFFKVGEDTVFISCMFSDTVYMVDRMGKCNPCYVLDYKDRSLNQSKYFETVAGFGAYMDACKDKNFGSGANDFVKQGDKLFFRINGKEKYFVLYDLSSDVLKLHKNLMAGLPNIYSKVGGNRKYVFYALTSSRLSNYFDKHPASDADSESIRKLRRAITSDEDNPVLLMCTIKN